MRNSKKRLFTLSLSLILLFSFVAGAEKEEMSIKWIYSEEGQQATSLPQFFWLDDGTVLLYDTGIPETERTLEKLDPRTGNRVAAVNQDEALASLKNILDEKDLPKRLSWPDTIDRSGKRAVYLFDGDIFLLNLQGSRFNRITKTEGEERSVRFSPDGSMLIFSRDNDLYVFLIETFIETRLTIDGSETIINRSPVWSNDSKAIAFIQSDVSPLYTMHYIDHRPFIPCLIKQRYARAGHKNAIVRLGIFEVRGTKPLWADLPYASFEYIRNIRWLPGSAQLSVQTLNRQQDDLNLYFVDRQTGGTKHVLQESDESWVNVHEVFFYLKKSKNFVWASERSGYAHVYLYSTKGELLDQVTKGDWAIRESEYHDPGPGRAVVYVDEKNEWIYFTAQKESSIEHQLYRIKFNGKGIERLSKEEGQHRVTFSPDAQFYISKHSNRSSPPSLALHKCDGTLVQLLAESPVEKLAKFDMQYPEFLSIPTKDGFLLPAELLKPSDFDPEKRYPLILYVYQGPSQPTVQNRWNDSIFFDQILLQNGYLVARVDNRSSAAISAKLEKLLWTEHRQMESTGELLDIVDAVQWLKKQPYIDSERVGIWGWSGGGSITLLAMTRSKEFKAGVAIAARTDWRLYNTGWTEFVMKRPIDNPRGYEESDLNKDAKNLHGRLLIVHGSYDDNVNIQNIWRFVDELIEHNKMFELMVYPMRKHGIRDKPARIHLFNTMLDFWKRHL
jgi:dipeptidyl-peptidase-4